MVADFLKMKRHRRMKYTAEILSVLLCAVLSAGCESASDDASQENPAQTSASADKSFEKTQISGLSGVYDSKIQSFKVSCAPVAGAVSYSFAISSPSKSVTSETPDAVIRVTMNNSGTYTLSAYAENAAGAKTLSSEITVNR